MYIHGSPRCFRTRDGKRAGYEDAGPHPSTERVSSSILMDVVEIFVLGNTGNFFDALNWTTSCYPPRTCACWHWFSPSQVLSSRPCALSNGHSILFGIESRDRIKDWIKGRPRHSRMPSSIRLDCFNFAIDPEFATKTNCAREA